DGIRGLIVTGVQTCALPISVASLDGEAATLESLRAPGKPLLLLFTDPGCGPCHALLPEASRWQDELAGELSVAVIATGSADDNRSEERRVGKECSQTGTGDV